MIRPRLPLFALVLLLAGSGAWWAIPVWLGSDARDPVLGGDEVAASDAAVAMDSRPAEPEVDGFDSAALPQKDDLRGIESSFRQRYPNARVVEVRLVRSGSGQLRRQQLLSTSSKRIPWVIWEDKLERAAEGDFVSVGSLAHMGTVFLIDAKPEVVPAGELEAFIEEHGLHVERESALGDYVCLGFEQPELGKLERLIAAFQNEFPGALAEFDTLSFINETPSEWDASRMWGLDMIRARDAWQFEKGDVSKAVVVAVIDTGAQTDHPDLAANLFVDPGGSAAVWDHVDKDANPEDNDGHGTHVSGIVGAVGNNGIGAVGVSWGVSVLPLKVGDADGLRTSAINDALLYVSALKRAGIRIVATNNSYGSGGANQSTRNEIAEHENLGILFVAAAGNDGRNMDASSSSLEYPAGYSLDNIISVGNSNQEDTLSSSSNFGSVSVDISAPGSEIYSTYPGGSYAFLSGTSMASPMVAGAVALLAQAEPDLSAAQLKERLLVTGDLVPSQAGLTVSGRRLNLLAALRPALSGHFMAVTNVKDALVLLDSVDSEAVFETASDASATVTATVFHGAEVGDVFEVGDGVFRFVPQANGQARIRFSARLQGLVRSVEKTVVVGDAVPVQAGLRHHYGFDGAGNTEIDLAGNSNGSVSGAARRSSEYGSSLDLDAVSENMSFNAQFSDRVSIAALVRSDDMSVSPHPRIVNMPFYYLYFSSGDGPQFPDGNRQTLKFFSNYANFGVWNSPPRSVKDGQWYYVVGTYDSTNFLNTPSLYLNGEAQEVRLQQEPTGTMVKTGGLSYVGNSDKGDRAFEGLVADIRIYDRELSPAEVSQLGAALMQDRWDSVGISVPSRAVVGEETPVGIEDSRASLIDLEAYWYVSGDAEGAVLSSNGRAAALWFAAVGSYTVFAQVSDGVATRVVRREIEVWDERVTEGHYRGSSESGGIAWLEVDASLVGGYVSVYDPVSGFYRFREPILLSQNGAFTTGEAARGRIFGSALNDLVVEVDGYDLLFEGGLQSVPSSDSDFAGNYVGGGVGQPGDSVRVQVLDDGRAFLWREGPFADLALGSVELEGRISTVSGSGLTLDLLVDLAATSIEGSWGEQGVFLKKEGSASEARLMAGIVGGYPSGSGALGMYSEFLKVGEAASDRLRGGGFARLGAGGMATGPLMVLSAAGAPVEIEAASEQGIVDSLARAVVAETVDLDSREVSGIRLQTLLSDAGSGLVGFSVVGSEPLEVLVRGLGRSFTVAGAEDPSVSIYRLVGGEALGLAPNDNWRDGALFTGVGERSQGAFRALESGFGELELSQLASDAKDAAQRVWLEPGDYVVRVQLASGAGGSALVEVFAL